MTGSASMVVTEVGWAEAAMRAIAAEADVDAGLVHFHFGSVDDLRRAATIAALAEAFAGPIEAMLAEPTAVQGLDGLMPHRAVDPDIDLGAAVPTLRPLPTESRT